MKYSLKYIELDSDGKPNQVQALREDEVVYTANLMALQGIKERNEKKYKNRRYIIVDENDKPIEALLQTPVEVKDPISKKKKGLTLEMVRKQLKRLA